MTFLEEMIVLDLELPSKYRVNREPGSSVSIVTGCGLIFVD